MNKAESLLQIPEMCIATSIVNNTDLRSCAVWQWYRRRCSEQAGFPLVQEAWHQPHFELAQAPMGAVKAGLCSGCGVSAPAFLLNTGAWPQAAVVCTASSLGIPLPVGLARTHSALAKVNFSLWGQPQQGKVQMLAMPILKPQLTLPSRDFSSR